MEETKVARQNENAAKTAAKLKNEKGAVRPG